MVLLRAQNNVPENTIRNFQRTNMKDGFREIKDFTNIPLLNPLQHNAGRPLCHCVPSFESRSPSKSFTNTVAERV